MKRWLYPGQSYPGISNSPWNYKFILSSGDPMFIAPSGGYGDLSDALGLAGQGISTPHEKVFDFHFTVCLPPTNLAPAAIPDSSWTYSGISCAYYDPSYGVTFTSPADFETKSIEGYAQKRGSDVVAPPVDFYHFAPAPLSKITFTPIKKLSY